MIKQPRHKLSLIDVTTEMADCSACGRVPVKAKMAGRRAGGKFWTCSISQARWNKNGSARTIYRRELKPHCERCGFVAVHPIQLEIHHKNGNHDDNNIDNLLTLCCNCHRLTHKKPAWLKLLDLQVSH